MNMRTSKFRHVFAQPTKKEENYDGIRITKYPAESQFCAVNPLFLAVVTEVAGGGTFLVIPREQTGRQDIDPPQVTGHTAQVLDIKFCPHDDHRIASSSEDCTIKVWRIPEGGLPAKASLSEPEADLALHTRRVNVIAWHPSAADVLVSAGGDCKVVVWDVANQEARMQIDFPDTLYSICFNYDGSKMVVACKDKKLRVVNPRSGEILTEGQTHPGSKPQQCVYLRDNRICTTGFSRMSERQYALWDDDDLTKPAIFMDDIDNSNGVMMLHYDCDTNLLFFVGKGDSVIRYYEYMPNSTTPSASTIQYLNRFDTTQSQRGFGIMPKRGLNVNVNEIARIYKLTGKNSVEVLPFIVPRKSDFYQEDIYPDTAAPQAALTAEQWFAGQDAPPLLMSLKSGFLGKDRAVVKNTGSTSSASATAASPSPSVTNASASSAASKSNETKSLPAAKTQSASTSSSSALSAAQTNGKSTNGIKSQSNEELSVMIGELTSRLEHFMGDVSCRMEALTKRLDEFESRLPQCSD